MSDFRSALSVAGLRRTRAELRSPWSWGLVAGICVAYALASMVLGQMLYLHPIGGAYFVQVIYGGNAGWWNYPGLLVVQPWGIVSLPFFATLSMAVVAVGVGVGGTVGIRLALEARRARAPGAAGAGTTGVAAGTAPAITGLATLGACCCTSCAGTAGIAVVAAASGTSLANLLANDWYIGVFQMVVVYVALVAQERALRLTAGDCPVPPPIDRRFVAGALLRLGLMVAGITWSLAMFVEWGTTPPLGASAATWYHWVFEHQLLALTAIAAGMFPQEFSAAVRRLAAGASGWALRAGTAIVGITWGVWVPPALVQVGLGGLLNEVLGYAGGPVGWGAIPPDSPAGAPLYFHWAFQHLLLAGFAMALASAPAAATAPLRWTVGGERPRGAPTRLPPVPPGDERPHPTGVEATGRPTATEPNVSAQSPAG